MKDLETKGYVIINDFLDRTLLEHLKSDYVSQKEIFLKTHNNITGQSIVESSYRLDKIINTVVLDIVKETNLNLGYPSTTGDYFDNQINDFVWHQDHKSYFGNKDSYNAINCWIPIIKNSLDESGIQIIPHDSFNNLSPEIFKTRIKGQGAKSFKVLNDHTLMRDAIQGTDTTLPFNINSIAITPKLKEGDLLILRQDLIHRTQDQNTKRVAISVRCYSKNYTGSTNTDFDEWLAKFRTTTGLTLYK
jgi:hypothetical protein